MVLKDAVSTASDVAWHIFKIIFMIIVVIVIIGGLWWMGYCTFWKPIEHPNPTVVQNAQSITNDSYYPEKTDFCLVNIFGWELLSKHSYTQKPIIKQTETPITTTTKK